MADHTGDNATGPIASVAELAFRRYEAQLGFWKVVLGTFIVGMAGVLIPGAVNFYTVRSENLRKQTELEISQQEAHQQYIKDFLSTGINQDIELRIRFADYFANLSGPGQEQLWQNYLERLRKLRDDNRRKINELEGRLVDFKKQPPDQVDNAEFDRVNRELAWANAEIGYVPTERSNVVVSADSSPMGKKVRLYRETTDLVERLASSDGPLVDHPDDLARFWDLYRKDLIGVESRDFARAMVAIGKLLNAADALNSPPGTELKRLAEDLVSISRRELADVGQASVVQEQQQQLQAPLQQQ